MQDVQLIAESLEGIFPILHGTKLNKANTKWTICYPIQRAYAQTRKKKLKLIRFKLRESLNA